MTCSTERTRPTRWSWPGRRSCTPRRCGRSPRSCPPWATTTSPALGDHDKREELAALTRVPVEILVGDSDKLTPKRHSRQMAAALPEARMQVVERTGHMLPQERPRLVTDAIERLLTAAVGDREAA